MCVVTILTLHSVLRFPSMEDSRLTLVALGERGQLPVRISVVEDLIVCGCHQRLPQRGGLRHVYRFIKEKTPCFGDANVLCLVRGEVSWFGGEKKEGVVQKWVMMVSNVW